MQRLIGKAIAITICCLATSCVPVRLVGNASKVSKVVQVQNGAKLNTYRTHAAFSEFQKPALIRDLRPGSPKNADEVIAENVGFKGIAYAARNAKSAMDRVNNTVSTVQILEEIFAHESCRSASQANARICSGR